MPARTMATVFVIAALAVGCADGSDGAPDVTAGLTCENDGGAGPYFLFDHQDWQFREAIDYPDDDIQPRSPEPSRDWYAEYEQLVPSTDGSSVEGISLRLSAHHVALAEHKDELAGFEPEEREINGVRALAGMGPDGEPTVVTMAVADNYTLMLLSYGLGLEELVEVASAVERVCQPAWVGAGGQVLDCVPIEPGCIADPSPGPTSTSSVPMAPTTEGP